MFSQTYTVGKVFLGKNSWEKARRNEYQWSYVLANVSLQISFLGLSLVSVTIFRISFFWRDLMPKIYSHGSSYF